MRREEGEEVEEGRGGRGGDVAEQEERIGLCLLFVEDENSRSHGDAEESEEEKGGEGGEEREILRDCLAGGGEEAEEGLGEVAVGEGGGGAGEGGRGEAGSAQRLRQHGTLKGRRGKEGGQQCCLLWLCGPATRTPSAKGELLLGLNCGADCPREG